jgi:hypothetical protein
MLARIDRTQRLRHRPKREGPAMTSISGIARFECLYRAAAGLDVDNSDLRRHDDLVDRKIHDLLLRAQATARANGRDVMQPFDVPIASGLQQRIHESRELDPEIGLHRRRPRRRAGASGSSIRT